MTIWDKDVSDGDGAYVLYVIVKLIHAQVCTIFH